jgi:hypothetical protein
MSSPARTYESGRSQIVASETKAETSISGVSWPAVFAGAFVTAAMSLTFMALGAGVSLSSISPWPQAGASVSRLAPMAIVWVILVQIISASIGGYMAGRLRTKWVNLHTHEVYFRDTAHGFLAWTVGLTLGLLFIASGIAKNATAGQAAQTRLTDYYVAKLFRTTRPEMTAGETTARTEAGLIVAGALALQGVTPDDQSYLSQLIVMRTGLSKAEAEKRVADTLAEARYAADNARKSLAHSFYWLFVALLCGAFCSSYAATIGGRQRDNIPAHVPG